MEEFQKDVNGRSAACEIYNPDVDIIETSDNVILIADLPGYSSEEIIVDLTDNILKIQTKEPRTPLENVKPVYLEYNCGIWMREFKLSGMFDESGISAEMKKGVLTLTIPKKESVKPRKIEIQNN